MVNRNFLQQYAINVSRRGISAKISIVTNRINTIELLDFCVNGNLVSYYFLPLRYQTIDVLSRLIFHVYLRSIKRTDNYLKNFNTTSALRFSLRIRK